MPIQKATNIDSQMALPLFGAGENTDATSTSSIWDTFLPPDITPSAYQAAIFDFVLHGQGDGIINAVAGAGKTWTLVQSARLLRLLPEAQRATFAAFNRHIAETLRAKLAGTPMTANTINGMGHGCLMKHLGGNVRVDEEKYKRLTLDWLDNDLNIRGMIRKEAERTDIGFNLFNLVRYARLMPTRPNDNEALSALAARFDLIVPEFALPGVPEILRQGEYMAADQNIIDFTDQLWLPFIWQLKPPSMDYVFVDECQDLSPAQLDLVLKSRAPGGRMLFVGDPHQSIMAFAGADADSFWNIKERTGATELPLSICYRCPRSHIAVAQKLVPHIQARPDAPEGSMVQMPENALMAHVQTGDLILCRMTAPLVAWCIKLIQKGIHARVRGVDVCASLITIIRRVGQEFGFDYQAFETRLNAYESQQRAYLTGRCNSAGRLQTLKDKCDAIRECYHSLEAKSVGELCCKTQALFSDDRTPVWLSTIHRAKGLENPTVYILYPHRLPLIWPDQQEWEWQQELNLRYVAVTRATERLILLQPENMHVDYTDEYLARHMAEKHTEYHGKPDC